MKRRKFLKTASVAGLGLAASPRFASWLPSPGDTVRSIQDQIASVRRELHQIISVTEAENQRNVALLASLDVVEADMGEISNTNQLIMSDGGATHDGGEVTVSTAIELVTAPAIFVTSAE